MKRNQKNLLGVIILIIFVSIYNYQTKYDTYDNKEFIKNVSLSLEENQEIIIFESKNPFNFYDILNNLNNVSSQTVYGIITYPEIKKNKYPIIIGVAGSAGWGEHHYKYLDIYNEIGIATLALHSFESRGVTSTVGEQVSATIPMVVHDAFSALNALSNNKKIDIDQVGITGWSFGGGVSLFAGWKPIMDKLSPNLKFAAHLPLYPPCVAKPDVPEFTDSPIHILIGELDNWVPAEPCDQLVTELKNMNYENIDITIYDNAHHSFDRTMDLKIADSAYRLEDCRLSLNDQGVVSTDTFIKIPMKNSIMQKLGLMFCAERGPTWGGNDIARSQSFEFAKSFFSSNLLND